MRGIARFAMRGVLPAATMAAVFALLGLNFPPALLVSGGVVALVTLRHGPMEALKVTLLAGVALVLMLQGIFGSAGAAGLVVLLPWVPVACAALVLRSSGQQGRAVALLAMFVGGLALSIRRAVPNVEVFWQERLTAAAKAVKVQGGQFLDQQEIITVASVMQEASLATAMLSLLGMLFLARWWQSGLYRPGAFGLEFKSLVVPVWAFPVALAAGLTSFLAEPAGMSGAVSGDLLVVLVILFAVQGLAIAHERVAAAGAHWAWLFGIYLSAMLMPHLVASALAATGAADFVADFRRRRPRVDN